jgi:hypothetical protein
MGWGVALQLLKKLLTKLRLDRLRRVSSLEQVVPYQFLL